MASNYTIPDKVLLPCGEVQDTVLNKTTTETGSLRAKIRHEIKTHARLSVDVETLGDSDDLYEAGMTSHASVMLMLALENEFNLEFPDNMLSRNVFESVNAIAAAVTRLQSAESL